MHLIIVGIDEKVKERHTVDLSHSSCESFDLFMTGKVRSRIETYFCACVLGGHPGLFYVGDKEVEESFAFKEVEESFAVLPCRYAAASFSPFIMPGCSL